MAASGRDWITNGQAPKFEGGWLGIGWDAMTTLFFFSLFFLSVFVSFTEKPQAGEKQTHEYKVI